MPFRKKTEGRKAHKQAATEGDCSENLETHLQGGNSVFGAVIGLQASDTDYRGFLYDYIYYVSQIAVGP